MKVLPIDKVHKADAYTIENEPIKSIDLMERAATRFYKWARQRINKEKTVKVIVGPGNNGGDGLVVARLFLNDGFNVEVYIIRFTKKESDDFATNLKRLKQHQDIKIKEIFENDKFPVFSKNTVIIDAIFGSGLSKPVKGFIAEVIKSINSSDGIVISLDMPSGLFADKTSINTGGSIVEADYTLSFQFPKLAFFFPENDKYLGRWDVESIGLHPGYIQSVDVKDYYLVKEDIRENIKSRNKYSHKGHFGHGLLISGSYGKMGAAVLATKAALRSGAGLITTHIPVKGYDIIQTSIPEAMVSLDPSETVFSNPPDLTAFNAIGIGPGIDKSENTMKALKLLIQNSNVPMVFDADAINILGENKTWISFVPKGSVFTPHPKEFERLAGKWSDEFERNKMQREFSFKFQSYVLLKGAHTAITTPDGRCYFNSTGNPGMATGGSGDVLTGIILGLLCQRYTSLEASLIGTFIHGLAGDIATEDLSEETLIAGDLINYLSQAFRELKK